MDLGERMRRAYMTSGRVLRERLGEQRSRELDGIVAGEVVVVMFEEGQGTVVHLLSHLYLQRSDVRSARDAQPAAVYLQEALGVPAPVMAACAAEAAGLRASEVASAMSTSRVVANAILSARRRAREGRS